MFLFLTCVPLGAIMMGFSANKCCPFHFDNGINLFNKQYRVMSQTLEKTETAHEFLLRKGIQKVHQPHKRYNLTISELVEFLNEFAERAINGNTGSGFIEERKGFNYRVNNDFVI